MSLGLTMNEQYQHPLTAARQVSRVGGECWRLWLSRTESLK